jgi:hypothetical protein
MQNSLIDPKIFPNLSSLEFNDVSFNFNDNNGLLSFFLNEKFKLPLSMMPNISYYKMKKEGTHLKEIEEFCKLHRTQPCTIEIEIWDP